MGNCTFKNSCGSNKIVLEMLTVKKRTYIHKFFQLAGIETTLKKEENVNKLKESFKTLYIHIFLLIQYSLDWTE